MTITITVGLGSLTIGETAFTLVMGVALGMLLDRWATMVRKREIEENDEDK